MRTSIWKLSENILKTLLDWTAHETLARTGQSTRPCAVWRPHESLTSPRKIAMTEQPMRDCRTEQPMRACQEWAAHETLRALTSPRELVRTEKATRPCMDWAGYESLTGLSSPCTRPMGGDSTQQDRHILSLPHWAKNCIDRTISHTVMFTSHYNGSYHITVIVHITLLWWLTVM